MEHVQAQLDFYNSDEAKEDEDDFMNPPAE